MNLAVPKIKLLSNLDKSTQYNFKIDATASIFFALYAGVLYPFFPATAVRLGIDGILLALLTASPFMGHIFAVYWGHNSENKSKRKFVFYSGFISRMLLIVLGLITNSTIFAIMLILHFVIAAAGWPAFTALMQNIYPAKERGRLMGLIQFIIGICRVGVTYGAGLMIDHFGHGRLFIVAGISGMIASYIIRKVKDPVEITDRSLKKRKFSVKETISILKGDRLFRLTMLGFFVFDLGNMLLVPIYPLYQVGKMGLSNFQIGQLSVFWMIGWFISAPFWGSLNDSKNPLIVIKSAILLFLISPVIYFLEPNFYILPLASISAGAAGSALEVGWLNQIIKLGNKKAAVYSGIYLTGLGLRGLIGPLIGGLLINYISFNKIFFIALLLMIFGLIPFIILKNNEPGKKFVKFKSGFRMRQSDKISWSYSSLK
ncbi:MAG: MFS transporter [Halanaerobiales bacterium]